MNELVLFALKAGVVVLAFVAVLIAITLSFRRRGDDRPHLEVRDLNERFEWLADSLRDELLSKREWKALLKERKKRPKQPDQPRVYVLDFDGDVLASAVTHLREEVTALLPLLRAQDEVVLRLESPGGGVAHYGLAAAQLTRLKERSVKLTVCVDRVAASGGYMMACVADTIVAAPFSIVGSIGVVAQVPNFHRVLKKYDVDYEELTAGEFKRTVSTFGEITEKGRAKFVEQLEETHALFKDFVKSRRPSLDVNAIANGEYWLGRRARELGLVDTLSTSDDYLLGRAEAAQLYGVRFRPKRQWRDRLGDGALALLARLDSLTLR